MKIYQALADGKGWDCAPSKLIWLWYVISCYGMINYYSYSWLSRGLAKRNEMTPWYKHMCYLGAGFILLSWETGKRARKPDIDKDPGGTHNILEQQAVLAHVQLIYMFWSSTPMFVFRAFCLVSEECSGFTANIGKYFTIFAVVSFALSITCTSRNSRRVHDEKRDICHAGAAMKFLETMSLLLTRVICIACLFSMGGSDGGVIIVLLFHTAVLFWFLFIKQEEKTPTTMGQKGIYKLAVFYAHFFGYVDEEDELDESIIPYYVIIYVITFTLDVTILIRFALIRRRWFFLLYILPLFAGILFRCLNYTYFYPGLGSCYRERDPLDWEKTCPRCLPEAEGRAPALAVSTTAGRGTELNKKHECDAMLCRSPSFLHHILFPRSYHCLTNTYL